MIDTERLETMYRQGDPVGDDFAARYLERHGDVGEGARRLFSAALAARHGTDGEIDAHMAEWLSSSEPLPAWATSARLDNGARFFAEWGIELGLGLFLSSLPLAYASASGAQVLALTARLETDAKRRVLESAQFLLDVTAEGGLEPGATGWSSARHVRLIHAGVRQLITNDPRLVHTDDPSVSPRWDEAWGVPINQQHLVGAMLSFSSSLLHVLDAFGIDYDEQGAEDYCLIWNVVGWLLGIEESVLPLDRAEMDRLEVEIRRRNEAPSDAGRELTAALLELVSSMVHLPGLSGYPATLMRYLIGDETADLLGVPPPDWTKIFVSVGRRLSRRLSIDALHHRLLRQVMRRISRSILKDFVLVERPGGRPPFTIPDHLGIDT